MSKVKIHIKDINHYVGREIGISRWWKISQSRVNKFAEATGDYQWLHVDEERAKTELPMAQTIVHNFLILSLMPQLFDEVLEITGLKFGQNRGVDNVRFLSSLNTGSEINLTLSLSKLEFVDQRGTIATFHGVVRARDSETIIMTFNVILLLVPRTS